MKRALVEFILPWLLGVALVVALSASVAHVLTVPSEGDGGGRGRIAGTSIRAD